MKGSRRIAMELIQKGIDKNIVSDALDSFEFDECSAIDVIFRKRYMNCDFNDDAELRRVYSYFARRGFKYENINRVVTNYRKN